MYTQTHKAKRKHTKRICEIYRSYLVTYIRLNFLSLPTNCTKKALVVVTTIWFLHYISKGLNLTTWVFLVA